VKGLESEIFTNGCFDILHIGHMELLKYCKSLGRVTVGLNSDQSVKRLKGRLRPINNQKDRATMLLSCKYVDDVVIFDEDTPIELIVRLKPDIIVKGGDYMFSEIVGSKLAEIRIFEYLEGYSTTTIISKIKSEDLGHIK
jgi:D-beta-D-heptose 7-phosphate kinase/D-beta-D-heptose 1-phosphate adenosyltransferase